MKKIILTTAAALLFTVAGVSAQTIAAQFTFEISQPATAGPFNAEINNLAGTGSATALGSHASGTTVYSSPAGQSSAHSFSSTSWAINDYYQISLSNTTGFNNLSASFAVTGSNTGPRDFSFQYSLDNATYTPLGAYVVTGTVTTQTFDLSGVPALNNSAVPVYFRLVDTSTVSVNNGTVAAGGTSRFDNFTIATVPEPATYAYVLGGLGALALGMRRRRSIC